MQSYNLDRNVGPLTCYTLQSIMNVYHEIVVVMFCALSRILALQYCEIQKQVDDPFHPDVDANFQLRTWSIRHVHACWAVSKMGSYFSYVLLVSVGATFTQVATNCFLIIEDIEGSKYVEAYRSTKICLLLYTICSAADFMRNSVSKMMALKM